MDERNKRASGITMVALAVTIVVLLILASVTIGALFGENGLINNVRNRKNNAYQKLVNEEVKQITTEYDIANSGETLEEFLEEKVKEGRVDEVTRKDDKTLEVKKDGYTVEVESENRDFSLIVEAYIGTYDEKTHDIISNLEVKPTDAKIEYSTDNGKTYSATMPTITNASSVQVTVRASRIGYKTETVTKTAIVNKAEGKVTLSATSGTITYPDSTTFMVSGNTGNLSVSSNSTNIATASISGSTVTVKPGTTAGKATITVTSAAATNYNAKSATYTATVNNGTITLSATPYTGTYDGKAHNAITSVTVNPSDAKIEYSTDGTNYSTTMPTVTNSSSFTFLHSYTFPILLFQSEECLRQVIDEIAGDEAFLAQVLDGEVAGKTMKVHTDAGSIYLFVAASQKSGDDACKHIATARRSHTTVARRAELHLTIRMTEG